MAADARTYRFFDRLVRVHSDNAAIFDALDAVYARQLCHPAPDDTPDLEVRVQSASAGSSCIEVGHRTVRVPDDSQLGHYAHLVLVNAAAALADDRLVLHSGAGARTERATLIVGPSGWGKTTLTMALVRRGWSFMSDDFAVVTPEGLVTPFPRRVNLTDESLHLLELAVAPDELRLAGFGGHEKWMVDIETLFPGRLAAPTQLGALFVLSPPAADNSAHDTLAWRLQLDHLPAGFEAVLADLPGVIAARRHQTDGPPVLDLTVASGTPVVAALDAACSDWDVSILSATRGQRRRPDFTAPPVATRITVRDGLAEVLAHGLSLSGRRFLCGTSSSEAMLELARLHQAIANSGASVYRLMAGELTATADLVESLAG